MSEENKTPDLEKPVEVEPVEQVEQVEPVEPVEQAKEAAKLAKKKARSVTCKYCNESFATRQTLASHLAKGICLGKGFMCLRCFKVKRTPSELQRHQSADNKCKISDSAVIKRDEKGNVNVIIER